ncbi:hypothetical protein BABINDRAFT_159170 [Babjeviella inositovora NRRL Y-12698]|uniref:Aminotransferase class I/classII large domain-containing protein n=1 Tax=Babjeviella inositovora NRRL Y-12698 TaxID=984486 RepID=A0A1E3QZV5_9ASCO|nr:uncharacterized protein BABINDRAFT_159170 [Babjeviella inositovora NRRL Y-12698]ODQ82617.1 hypothetical protein BABINDRAFT_159170 [Babjeviella inositovora NRRL Y-12698]
MVFQEDFEIEKFMNKHEHNVVYNLGETCCYSMSLKDLEVLTGNKAPLDTIFNQRLVYGWIEGSDELRDLICDVYNKDGCAKLVREDVVVTNGAIGANFLTMYGLVGKGDHVVVVNPTYQQLQSVPKIFEAEVSLLDLKFEENWLPNLDALQKLVQPNTKMIVINNPNNPTGSVMDNELLLKIVDIARAQDAYLLCDEVYRPLFHSVAPDKVPDSIVNLYEKGISTCSVSKAFSFAGVRVGWIISRDHAAIAECITRRDYNTISVSMVDDIIGSYVLQNRNAILKHNYQLCIGNLAILEEFIQSSNGVLDWVKPAGGTTAFVKINGLVNDNTEDFCDDMAVAYKTLVAPGENFNNRGYVRIGFGNSKEDLLTGLPQLKKSLKDKGLWK